ncbi:hypothetical protein [Magnetospirillum sulfuroxidans]|uniref:KAP NTPase domain-containing protein n=1 Tax=Magnetospirillum sulfuroxidans TaxID=611300 RepID=A0ABS5IBA2_9PROT|nr:hypothetical protein [Magnetospirillum sulfuroxidans]MBR9971711.1 hypothetical protein [Magnetospirillum sulfuroxidans]
MTKNTNSDTEALIDELKKLYSSRRIHLSRSQLSENAKINRPRPSDLNPRAQDRYGENDITDVFEYTNDFFKNTERCLFKLPPGREVFNKEYGYCYPSDKHVENFTHQEGYRGHINRSERSVDDWVCNIINKINLNNISKTEQYLPHIEFITGKVGSGKSTFVNFFSEGYRDKFIENNILFTLIPHDLFSSKISADRTKQALTDDIRYIEITKTIQRSIAASFSQNDILINKIGGREKARDDFSEFCKNKGAAFDKKDLHSVVYPNTPVGENTLRSLSYLPQFLAIKGIKFLVSIDGLDALSFGSIVKGEYTQLFNDLATVIFGEKQRHHTIPHTNYIITLRDCTYETFVCAHSERLRRVEQRKLVPCEFNTLLRRGVAYFIQHDKSEKSFWRGREDSVEWFWRKLLETMSKALGIKNDEEISKFFDYNHRQLMESVIEVATFVLSGTIKGKDSEFKDIFDLFEYIKRDGSYLSSSSQYDIFEAFLIRDRIGFFNKVQLGKKYSHDIFGATVDNLFNYHLDHKDQIDIPNFLLIKVRILQYLDKINDYCDIESIDELLKCLGYHCSRNELTDIMEILQAGGFVKIVYKNDKYTYSISNFGYIAINRMLFNMRYIENVILDTFVPRILSSKFKGQYKHNSVVSISRWIEQSLINTFLFLQVIMEIERAECEIFEKNKGNLLFDNFYFRISPKLTETICDFIDNIDESRTVNFRTLSDNIVRIIQEYKDNKEQPPHQLD